MGFKDSRAACVWSIIVSFQLILKTLTREDASIWILVSRNLYNIYCFPHFKVAPLWNPKTHLGPDQTESITLIQKPITRRYTSGGNCQNLVLSPAKLVSYSVVIYILLCKSLRNNSKCNYKKKIPKKKNYMHKKNKFAHLISVYFVDKNTNEDVC